MHWRRKVNHNRDDHAAAWVMGLLFIWAATPVRMISICCGSPLAGGGGARSEGMESGVHGRELWQLSSSSCVLNWWLSSGPLPPVGLAILPWRRAGHTNTSVGSEAICYCCFGLLLSQSFLPIFVPPATVVGFMLWRSCWVAHIAFGLELL